MIGVLETQGHKRSSSLKSILYIIYCLTKRQMEFSILIYMRIYLNLFRLPEFYTINVGIERRKQNK